MTSTRASRRCVDPPHTSLTPPSHTHPSHIPSITQAELKEHEEVTKIKNVSNVRFGKFFMECWYFSPFPKEYFDGALFIDMLYFCEFSFRFFRTAQELQHYQAKPELPRHPPGTEIYRDEHVSMFELDGSLEKIYCQNLCYFAKLFLDHKVSQSFSQSVRQSISISLTLTPSSVDPSVHLPSDAILRRGTFPLLRSVSA